MLHIIGLNHRAQAQQSGAEETTEQRTFTGCLQSVIQEVGPVFIAEEDSEEALAERQETSISKRIADDKGIEHRFRDPTRAQRDELHYRDGQTIEVQMHMRCEPLSDEEIHLKSRAIELGNYFPIRERLWFDRLGGCRERDAIFICGDAHIGTFTSLLDRERVPHRIVERGIGVTAEEREDFRRISEYLKNHPELIK